MNDYRVIRPVLLVALLTLVSGCAGSWFYVGQHPSTMYQPAGQHMSEDIRASIQRIEIRADSNRPVLSVGGDYGQHIPSVGEGAGEGVAAGAVLTGEMIAEDPRAIILAPFVLPVAMIAGGITGAAAAKIKQELAEFREGLADELANDQGRPMPSDEIVAAVRQYFASSRSQAHLADDGETVLTLQVSEIAIETDKRDAVITTYATGTVSSSADGSVLYKKQLEYSERDKLRNWTDEASSAWTDYAERARHFIASELIASIFETIHVRQVLRPKETESVAGSWSGRAKSLEPVLGWELFLLGGDTHSAQLDEAAISYDLRAFDDGRLVYEATGITRTEHKVEQALPSCTTLAWSVRPVYKLSGGVRAGEWMQQRQYSNLFAQAAANDNGETPAFWSRYSKLRTRCSS